MDERRLLLGDCGCDRSSAYHMSTKFAFGGQGLWVTWLACPFQVRLSRVDLASFSVTHETPIAYGFDNHCGASLALEPSGRLHVIAGAHHQSFIHRYSDTPTDPASWSPPFSVGKAATYPSTALSRNGRHLHLALRSSVEPWTLAYHRCELDADPPCWSELGNGRAILRAPHAGYCFWTNSLAVDNQGTLHLLAEFYKQYTPGVGYSPAITHVYSQDDGLTWRHTDGRELVPMPAGLEHVTPILFRGGGDLRPGHLRVLADQSLVFTVFDTLHQQVMLFRRRPGGQWTMHDWTEPLRRAMPDGWAFCSHAALAQDSGGQLHAALVVAPQYGFGHPESRLLHVRTGAEVESPGQLTLLPAWRDGHPDWLPALHPLDAGRCVLLHQSGGRGPNNRSDTRTQVALRLLNA